ncbi:NAD-dependent epimerase/dehydratase family protein [Actinoplanes sp. RD1]|uniref:NAD-dependent epimerase/dehydratase family protein n=1 Tax=Actinoplanes sp. RD1 TaxID=3064538 RepID=UPI0027409C68|nr:NAD(P)-dependent oxidoreductase [Actinoplanes sp. RD1]
MDALRTQRILVTGSTGMLGSHLARRLAGQGHDVLGVDIRAAAAPVAGVQQVQGDIRDTALLTELTTDAGAVVHCAGALPTYPAEQIRAIVVDGTRSVLEAAYRNGVPRVVHISSTAVYGLPDLVPTPEEYPFRPTDTYSAAKGDAERVCEEYRELGVPLTILRPKTFLGPGRMGLFAMLFEWADEGRNFPVLGRGDVRIQMLDIEDLLDAVELALAAPPGGTFNIAADQVATMRENLQCVLDEAGHGKRVVSVPGRPAVGALRVMARLGVSPVYDRLLHKLLADSYVSIERARKELGFQPRYSGQEAILRTYRWWREQQQVSRAPAASGRTSSEPWRQGALSLAKALF